MYMLIYCQIQHYSQQVSQNLLPQWQRFGCEKKPWTCMHARARSRLRLLALIAICSGCDCSCCDYTGCDYTDCDCTGCVLLRLRQLALIVVCSGCKCSCCDCSDCDYSGHGWKTFSVRPANFCARRRQAS